MDSRSIAGSDAVLRYEQIWAAPERGWGSIRLAAAFISPVLAGASLLWLQSDDLSRPRNALYVGLVALFSVLIWASPVVANRFTLRLATELAERLRNVAMTPERSATSRREYSARVPFALDVVDLRPRLELGVIESHRITLFGLWPLAAPYATVDEQRQLTSLSLRRRSNLTIALSATIVSLSLIGTGIQVWISSGADGHVAQIFLAAASAALLVVGAIPRTRQAARDLHQAKVAIVLGHAAAVTADLDITHIYDEPVQRLIDLNRRILNGAIIVRSRTLGSELSPLDIEHLLKKSVGDALTMQPTVDIDGELAGHCSFDENQQDANLTVVVRCGNAATAKNPLSGSAHFSSVGGQKVTHTRLKVGVDAIGWNVVGGTMREAEVNTRGDELTFEFELQRESDDFDPFVFVSLYCAGRFLESLRVRVDRR